MSLNPQKVKELKAFVGMLKANPDVLHSPELSFFKEYLHSMNATIPEPTKEPSKEESCSGAPENVPTTDAPSPDNVVSEEEDGSEEDEESAPSETEEAEEPDPEVIEAEKDPLPELAPEGEEELTDAQQEKIQELKQKAQDYVEEGKLKEAVDVHTEVLLMGNPSAMSYTRRADLLLKLKRPLAAIQDCSAALKLNPDNAKGYKLRGKARRLLGQWELAHEDLETGQKLDYDDELWEMQKLVGKRFQKIEEKRRSRQRKADEKEKKRKEKEIKKRRAAAQRRYEEEKRRDEEFNDAAGAAGFPGGMGGFPGGMGGFPGGMGGMPGGMGGMPGGMGGMPGGMGGMPGGMGGMPGGMGGMPGGEGGFSAENMAGLFANPDIQKLLQNPKVMEAMAAMNKDPAAASQQYGPEFFKTMSEMAGKASGGEKADEK